MDDAVRVNSIGKRTIIRFDMTAGAVSDRTGTASTLIVVGAIFVHRGGGTVISHTTKRTVRINLNFCSVSVLGIVEVVGVFIHRCVVLG